MAGQRDGIRQALLDALDHDAGMLHVLHVVEQKPCGAARSVRELALVLVQEVLAVRQAGQEVVGRPVLQRALELLALGHVALATNQP
jgi:hypothetical protein